MGVIDYDEFIRKAISEYYPMTLHPSVRSGIVMIDQHMYLIPTCSQITSWLLDNIGKGYELSSIPQILYIDEHKDKWAIETYEGYIICWIENNTKRLEFILTWC